MKEQLFILNHGKLFCDKGTLSFIDLDNKKSTYPLTGISEIFCFGNVSLTSGIIKKVLERELIVHFLSTYGTYQGCLQYATLHHAKVIERQVLFSVVLEKRLAIALELLRSLQTAQYELLAYYAKKGHNVFSLAKELKAIEFEAADSNQLRGKEAQLWKLFYEGIKRIITTFDFVSRVYHPPQGEINAMISFGNMLLYAEVLAAIREVGLLPEIGYIHENNDQRYTLALDLAELFKPLLVFRSIIYLSNKKIIQSGDFTNQQGYTYLNHEGKFLFVREFQQRLKTTFFHPDLKRDLSYRSLIKQECLALKSYFLHPENGPYQSFKRWYTCF
ncbi:MAG: CRISPR-associated endonuclease Cas1 [Candidatus Woesearchaeota archaeon]